MVYVLIDMVGGDMFTEEFNDKAAALNAARNAWEGLTDYDKKRRESFCVLKSVNPDEEAENHLDGDVLCEVIDGVLTERAGR